MTILGGVLCAWLLGASPDEDAEIASNLELLEEMSLVQDLELIEALAEKEAKQDAGSVDRGTRGCGALPEE